MGRKSASEGLGEKNEDGEEKKERKRDDGKLGIMSWLDEGEDFSRLTEDKCGVKRAVWSERKQK